ncbi:hypothetical protein JOB18_012638 [Solea senegalensis]|uniref:Uncharacterized protein n=1 Tax=Solea senegalensis TaxID=28829 RepID=A0AAV6Q162_SOLSE|nr:hypothetical protein JOB18_012638 [Solea senegalensis]
MVRHKGGRVTAHQQSVAATRGGPGKCPELMLREERVAAIIGETSLTGILQAREGDSVTWTHP